jgi:hypothetical protein
VAFTLCAFFWNLMCRLGWLVKAKVHPSLSV